MYILDKTYSFVALPEGIRNVGDIFESQAFKNTVSAEEAKPREPFDKALGYPKTGEQIRVVHGQGRSILSEYLKSLKQYSYTEIQEGIENGELRGLAIICYELE